MRRYKQSYARGRRQFRRTVKPIRRVNYAVGYRGGIHV